MSFTKRHVNLKNSTITRVAIGIQARSTSERFPEKVFADICGKPMLQWVVDAAKESAHYLSRPNLSRAINVEVYLLVPTGDRIKNSFHHSVAILEGPEHDVLTRYKRLLDFTKADYVVRLTGDCPLLPPPVITKAINVAVMNYCDYVSNVDSRLRLSFDGMDCEVMSAGLLEYMDENATSVEDREHVTTFARSSLLPNTFKTGHIVGHVDLSGLKLSVDTEEDLEAVRHQKARVLAALKISEAISGERATHRF